MFSWETTIRLFVQICVNWFCKKQALERHQSLCLVNEPCKMKFQQKKETTEKVICRRIPLYFEVIPEINCLNTENQFQRKEK